MKTSRMALAAALGIVASGCGGGGLADAVEDGVEVGAIVGGSVSGLRYRTSTQAGVTNQDGEFLYVEGERVVFSLGDTVIGSAQAAPALTLFDLAGADMPIGEAATRLALKKRTSPFHHVVNLAVLLQTLDVDRDVTNGIEITEDTAALFNGVELPLEKDSRRFERHGRVRLVFGAVRGVLGPRPVVSRAYAMERLYRELGVDAKLFVLTEELRDGEGSNARINSRWDYDVHGNTIARYLDRTGDRLPDSIERTEYNADGQRVSNTTTDADGSPGEVSTYEYDENGYATRRTHDFDGDGVNVIVEKMQNDINGHTLRLEYDDNGDDIPDTIQASDYDAFGNKTRYREDTDNDNDFDYEQVSTFDDDGNLIKEQIDQDGDGGIDIVTTYTRDAAGNVLRIEMDFDGDGVADTVESYEYNADGLKTRSVNDRNRDGTPDIEETWAYDADGRLLQYTVDLDMDGIGVSIESHEYNNLGQEVRYTRSKNDSFGFSLVRTLEYDGDGNLIRRVDDRSATRSADEIRTYSYAPTEGWAHIL